MAVISHRPHNDSNGISLKLKLEAAALLLRETILHPRTTSRIIIEPEENRVHVERGPIRRNGATSINGNHH